MAFPDFTPTVPELVKHAADRFGDRTYLVANGERLTYHDVDARSAALAKGLLAEGIGKGSRVGDPDPEQLRLPRRRARRRRGSAQCSYR